MSGRKTGPDRRRPGLRPEDHDLWARVAGRAKPLSKRKKHVETPEPSPEAVPKKPEQPPPPRPHQAAASESPALPPLSPGTAPGVDRRTADRLRRGQLPIQARLDLHGNTKDEALVALREFIPAAREAGRRSVLVITGKGRRSGGAAPAGVIGGHGVLREMVPHWLNAPELRPHVLAFAHAQPRDGGEGALYVLLRRRRG